jgi:hypothetical protein
LLPDSEGSRIFAPHGVIVSKIDVVGETQTPRPKGAKHANNVSSNKEETDEEKFKLGYNFRVHFFYFL